MKEIFEIVEPGAGDVAAITALAAELSEGVDGPDALVCRLIERNVRELFDAPDTHFLMAKVKQDVVGFVNFGTRQTLLHAARSGLIDELIVKREYRGRGIARKLIEAVLARCRDRGCSEVEVSTLRRNEDARSFYRACGFEEDAVLCEIDLGE